MRQSPRPHIVVSASTDDLSPPPHTGASSRARAVGGLIDGRYFLDPHHTRNRGSIPPIRDETNVWGLAFVSHMVGTSDRPTDEPTTDHTADDTDTETILSDTDDDPASKYDIDTDNRAIIVDSDGTPQMTMPRNDHNQFVNGEER